MLLAVDVGNSQTSYGLFEGDKLLRHWRAVTLGLRTADQHAAFLFPLLHQAGIEPKQIKGVALCSVVPSADHPFFLLAREYFQLPLFKIHSEIKIGCEIRVDTPAEVGADRLANAAYAVENLTLPAIVIDLGTATTFDVITKGPSYEGGVILPGLQMAVEALGGRTAKLPVVNLKFPTRVIAKSTIECIQAGVLYGYVDLIDGLISRTVKELGETGDIVLTGGIAPLLHKHLNTTTKLLPDLTLEGIRLLYNKNT